MTETEADKEISGTCAAIREEILWVALDLFIENGYDATTMRMIMDRTGKRSGSIYYLYSGKEDILGTVVAEIFERTLMLADALAGPFRGDFAVLLTPPLELLYSSERSPDLGRLLHRAFSMTSINDRCTDLAWEWASRNGIGGIVDEERFKAGHSYALGGLSAMLGRISEGGSEGYRRMLYRHTSALYGIFGAERPEGLDRTIDALCSIVEDGDVTIMSDFIRGRT